MSRPEKSASRLAFAARRLFDRKIANARGFFGRDYNTAPSELENRTSCLSYPEVTAIDPAEVRDNYLPSHPPSANLQIAPKSESRNPHPLDRCRDTYRRPKAE